MHKVRLNTPGIQYWVSSFDIHSNDLTLTNVTKDAALFDDVDIPFIEGGLLMRHSKMDVS